jgi:pimeloyl-ACP methyl ester carboxylesterase
LTAKSKLAGWFTILAITIAVSGCGATVAKPEAGARPGRLARLADGRRLNFRCSGRGPVMVILESGFGGDSLAWFKVRPLLEPRFRVCAYDRAGAGFSDSAPAPRDGAAVARDLDQGLRAAHIGPPFILVGHSSGGLYVRVFAGLRPRDVVGLVLVDPSVPYQDRRLADRFGPGAGSLQGLIDRAGRCLAAARAGALPSDDPALKACVAKSGVDTAANAARLEQARNPGKWIDQISELETLWTSTSDEASASNAALTTKPLIVLTADGTYAGASAATRPAIDAYWSELHREIAALSSRGREERVARSSHLMMLDRPDAIAAAVEEVAGEAGGFSTPPGGTGRSAP